MHDDSLRTEFENDLKEREERAENERRAGYEREEREQEEREREYKTGEWMMIINYHEKNRVHDGYCSDAGSINTDYENDCCKEIYIIPHYVKSEHVKDFVVVDKDIISKLCYEHDIIGCYYGSGYCAEPNEEPCGMSYTDINIEIRPSEKRLKRLLLSTKLNENIIGLIVGGKNVGFW